MAIRRIQTEERFETDTETEAEELVMNAKAEYDVTRSMITKKYRKSDETITFIVDIRKNFVPID